MISRSKSSRIGGRLSDDETAAAMSQIVDAVIVGATSGT
jgi:hypothetical protein